LADCWRNQLYYRCLFLYKNTLSLASRYMAYFCDWRLLFTLCCTILIL